MTPSDRLREIADILDAGMSNAKDGLSIVAVRLIGCNIVMAAENEMARTVEIANRLKIPTVKATP